MRKTRFLFIVAMPLLIAACTTGRGPAPVVDRQVVPRVAEAPKPPVTVPAQPSTVPGQRTDNRGYYTVRKGDTLLQIALDFGQNYRDLVTWNNLANPNDIKVDQVLRVMPPEGAPQTGSVTAATGVEVRPLTPGASIAGSALSHKSGPRGEKRPYSDATLAEMQKPDSMANSAPAAPVPKAEPPKTADKSPEPAPAQGPDEENIAWIWPADGKVISAFTEGKRGIDIAGKMGQPILAAGSGKVLYAGSGIRGYGNLVIVKHTNNLLSAYAHNKTIFVKEDQNVSKGQKIAEMGNSDTDEVKLHFEIRQQGKPVDPSKFLPNR
ncbi:peptidoglycan DD-metalloendopeptidase family protein [Noviherbaspirillum saxi]|uniref:LysM peptidoglycan-binding domain-containing protein n=1 Tax=Noviherbaspirillum saxi TaxID=2320863 RepID=A0A3A3FTZ2_9BURK|nr:peptidoglycan DD-metalloendopeptidase family protein [Noviherbaspirillum saxi]RJF98734.1 LysM peptidoglycan-binding domain-containing protein [Noviherbaspirillum saxi]